MTVTKKEKKNREQKVNIFIDCLKKNILGWKIDFIK